VIGAVVAAIAIVAAVGFVVARRDVATPGARTPSTVGPPASSLVKLDPATGDVRFVRRDVPGLAYGGSRVLSAAGSVWLIRPPLVLKVDPQDGSSLPVAGLESGSANELGVGLGRVWAIGYELWPIDPAAGRAGAPIDYGQQGAAFFNGSGVVAAFDRVWVSTTAHAVVEVDPRTRETRSIDVGETPGAIAAGAASVWVLDETANAVSRIDPSSGRALDPIPLTGRQDALAIGEGFVWVLDGRVGTLTPIDEASGEVRSPVDVGAGASSVAVGGGSIWVANGGDVLEIDPASFGVSRTIHVGERPIASLAVGEDGALWLDMAKES
jgi:streptogramin lyase